MRNALLPIVLLALIPGCTISTSPSLDPLVSLIRDQNDKLKAMQDQMVLLQNQITGMKDRPPAAAFNVESSFGRRYRLTTTTVAGQKNMDAIYVMEQTSGRMVVMMFNAGNEKLEIIAGRDLSQDVKRGDMGRTPISAPAFGSGSNVVAARGAENEQVLVVADDANQKLLIYKLDVNRKRLQLVASEDLAKLFSIKSSSEALPRATPRAPAPPPVPTPVPVPTQPAPDTPAPPRPAPGPPTF